MLKHIKQVQSEKKSVLPWYPHRRLIYLIEKDKILSKELSSQLESRGYQVKVFHQLHNLSQVVLQEPPMAIVIEVMLSEGELTAPKWVLNIQKNRSKPLPVIFISSRVDMLARQVAARANGHAYFDKPLNINALVEKLNQLTAVENQDAYRVLIVDDTGKYADNYAKVLQQAHMQSRILRDPMRILEALPKFQPNLLMINAQLLGFNALELAVIIRQQEKSTYVPIIFFAQPIGPSLRQLANRGVADDFLGETESPERVVASVTTCIKNAERYLQFQELVNRDSLTGLYNRRYLFAQLELLKPTHPIHPLTVLYIHLDCVHNSKKIIGLSERDTIIVDTARLLREQVNPYDILARLNDQVFVILSFDRTLEEVKHFAQSIQEVLERRVIKFNHMNILTTCSIGVGAYRQANNAQQALLDASMACIQAREQGQEDGQHIQLHETAIEQEKQSDKEKMIRSAFKNNQFYLAYQPIAPVHGEAFEYYDVLLRTYAGTAGGNLPTSELIAVAEQSDLILQIDRWVILQAIINADEKHRQGQKVHFFVRISGASLSDSTLLPWLRKLLTDKAFHPSAIIFDMHKTVMSQSLEKAQYFISYMKALGCGFAIKDFDNHAETFQLLDALEIDFVKIQGELIRGLARKSENMKTIQSLIKALHGQKKRVIAPFVEDADSLSLLWQYEVDYIEGNFVQAPGEQLDFIFSD